MPLPSGVMWRDQSRAHGPRPPRSSRMDGRAHVAAVRSRPLAAAPGRCPHRRPLGEWSVRPGCGPGPRRLDRSEHADRSPDSGAGRGDAHHLAPSPYERRRCGAGCRLHPHRAGAPLHDGTGALVHGPRHAVRGGGRRRPPGRRTAGGHAGDGRRSGADRPPARLGLRSHERGKRGRDRVQRVRTGRRSPDPRPRVGTVPAREVGSRGGGVPGPARGLHRACRGPVRGSAAQNPPVPGRCARRRSRLRTRHRVVPGGERAVARPDPSRPLAPAAGTARRRYPRHQPRSESGSRARFGGHRLRLRRHRLSGEYESALHPRRRPRSRWIGLGAPGDDRGRHRALGSADVVRSECPDRGRSREGGGRRRCRCP